MKQPTKIAPIGIVLQANNNRYGRERVDLPLAMASLDIPVRVLVMDQPADMLLPTQSGELAWTKLWQAAAELDVEICILDDFYRTLIPPAENWQIEPLILDNTQMVVALSECRHLIHV